MVELQTEGHGTWLHGEIGYGKQNKAGPIAALWASVGDVNAIGIRAGVKF